jgi:hypothetical protein
MQDWSQWGFSQSPFNVTPLLPDDAGLRLCVGREAEVELVASRLHRQQKVTCVDGKVGVGKTSLVNISAYTCLKRYLARETTQLLIPAGKSFQLAKNESVEEFAQKVFRTVAQALLDAAAGVKRDLGLDMKDWPQVDKWLNSAQIESVHTGLHWFVNIGKTHHPNIGQGFTQHGLEQIVTQWLAEIFPQHGSGGVVCVIDNMELLETSDNARSAMEEMRDRLFNIPGIRWVLCGANGVIHALAASPRLSGYLAMPVVEVEDMSPSEIPSLIDRRVKEFAIEGQQTYVPIDMDNLQHLYTVANFNLRSFFALADEYCCYIMDKGAKPTQTAQRETAYRDWLSAATTQRHEALKPYLGGSEWAILDIAMSDEFKGSFGVSQYDEFNKNTSRNIVKGTFKKHLAKLKKHNLISRSIERDDDDETALEESRELYTVTPQGALVHFARVQNREIQTFASTDWLRRVHFRTG